MDRISLSASEWRVMKALWTGPKALMELVRELGDSAGWAKSTVATMVRRMEAKGLIEGRPEGRRKVFHPLLRRQDAAASETDSLLERAYHGSVGLLVSGLVERNRRLRPGGAVRHSAQGGGGNMKEILVSSSLLILLLAALRPLLRGRIRPQAAYALWPLVALRLLVPVSPVRSALSAGALLGEPPVLEALGETAVPVRSYEQAYRQVEAESFLPVYVSGDLPSPCLSGLLRPAVYVTPAALESPERLRHVLAHEETHCRHGDHWWGLLRCLCLYWFDPLVWWAAALSRRDCELACDAGAIRRLGEAERFAYGRTLVDMIAAGRTSLLQTATTMTGGRRHIRQRVTLIARRPRTVAAVAAALALVLALAVGCAFTAPPEPPALLPLGERLAEPPEELHALATAGSPVSWRNTGCRRRTRSGTAGRCPSTSWTRGL